MRPTVANPANFYDTTSHDHGGCGAAKLLFNSVEVPAAKFFADILSHVKERDADSFVSAVDDSLGVVLVTCEHVVVTDMTPGFAFDIEVRSCGTGPHSNRTCDADCSTDAASDVSAVLG